MLDSQNTNVHYYKKLKLSFKNNMLRIILILLLSVQIFTINNKYFFINTAHSSQIKIFPQKRPTFLASYEESLRSIHDVIEKEGGKKTGILKTSKIRNGENLNKFLLRVGFSKVNTHKIINSIKLHRKSYEFFYKIPINHKLKYFLPSNSIGGSLAFKIEKNKDIYVWQNLNNDFVSKITKRPTIKKIDFKEGIIKTNLYNASKVIKMPDQAFYEMISILGFIIDFQRDIRRGDRFEVLFSKVTDLIEDKVINTEPIQYVGITLSGNKVSYYRYKTKQGYISYFNEKGISAKKTLMKTPLNGARISSGYGNRKHPILGYTKMHRGVDFAAPKGTPVFAAGNGIIEKSGWNGSYGKYIRIRHNSSYKTAYAHLSKIIKQPSSRVQQGQIIGYVGNTGRSTGPHLHYEIIFSGKKVNPMKIKLPSGKNIPKSELEIFKSHVIKIKKNIYIASQKNSHSNPLAFSKIKNN